MNQLSQFNETSATEQTQVFRARLPRVLTGYTEFFLFYALILGAYLYFGREYGGERVATLVVIIPVITLISFLFQMPLRCELTPSGLTIVTVSSKETIAWESQTLAIYLNALHQVQFLRTGEAQREVSLGMFRNADVLLAAIHARLNPVLFLEDPAGDPTAHRTISLWGSWWMLMIVGTAALIALFSLEPLPGTLAFAAGVVAGLTSCSATMLKLRGRYFTAASYLSRATLWLSCGLLWYLILFSEGLLSPLIIFALLGFCAVVRIFRNKLIRMSETRLHELAMFR